MNKKLKGFPRFLILISLSALINIFPEDKEYSVDRIPELLLKDAEAVVRVSELKFEVFSGSSAVKTIKFAATIFKKEQQHFGELVIWYDKFTEIDDLEGKIYNAAGEEIRELEDEDIKDFSAYAGYTFFDDNRVRTAELYHNAFPYTVEFFYTVSYNEEFNWPSWKSRDTHDPVEKSSFEVIIPADQDLRFWCNDDSVKSVIQKENGKKVYLWKAVNQCRLPYDSFTDIEDAAAVVRIAPSEFEIEGYSGRMNSWKEFGQWAYSLYKNRGTISSEAISEVKALLNTHDSEKDKIEKVYKYMQSRTRYVNISLGIGGWQPFEADFVHSRGYGDCKALSNYMVSLLKAVNIKAYIVLINSGSRIPMITEFPSNQFNHVIVCVPGEKDTFWLECTSQNILFGIIHPDNENRRALMITQEGGIVVNTPVSCSEQNLQTRYTKVKLMSYGSASADVITTWKGNQQNYVLHRLIDANPADIEKWVLESYEVPEVKLSSFTFDGLKERKKEIILHAQVTLLKYATATGSRIFFQPNIQERRTYVPKDINKRYSPISFDYPYLDIDSVCFSLPKGYTIETLPGDIKIESSFGRFISSSKPVGDSSIVYARCLEINTYSISADNYTEYRNFFAAVAKSDRAQIVLVKKEH